MGLDPAEESYHKKRMHKDLPGDGTAGEGKTGAMRLHISFFVLSGEMN